MIVVRKILAINSVANNTARHQSVVISDQSGQISGKLIHSGGSNQLNEENQLKTRGSCFIQKDDGNIVKKGGNVPENSFSQNQG